jgi:hypothetical protein
MPAINDQVGLPAFTLRMPSKGGACRSQQAFTKIGLPLSIMKRQALLGLAHAIHTEILSTMFFLILRSRRS